MKWIDIFEALVWESEWTEFEYRKLMEHLLHFGYIDSHEIWIATGYGGIEDTTCRAMLSTLFHQTIREALRLKMWECNYGICMAEEEDEEIVSNIVFFQEPEILKRGDGIIKIDYKSSTRFKAIDEFIKRRWNLHDYDFDEFDENNRVLIARKKSKVEGE